MSVEIILRILANPLALAMVVLFFGASIFVHEWGHYLAARWRGLKISRFSIGFGPRLFGWTDRRGVEWRVAPIPLGGYVMLPQLADLRGVEGDAPATTEPLPPISYTDKVTVAAAGAVFNVLFALALATLLWAIGTRVPDAMATTQVGYVIPHLVDSEGNEHQSPAKAAGIQAGDRILEVDGDPVNDWNDVMTRVATGSRRSSEGEPLTVLKVERAGEIIEFQINPTLSEYERMRIIGFVPATRLIVDGVMHKSPAEIAGLEPGDEILSINGELLYDSLPFIQHINAHPNELVRLEIRRGEQRLECVLRPESVVYNTNGDERPMVGIQFTRSQSLQHVDPFTQIRNHIDMTVRVLVALFHPATNVGLNNLSGPVGIGYALYSLTQIGMRELLAIVVLININLAILNLLPIPVLDGGHIVFATIAKLRRKPLPASFIASAQSLFMLLFLGIFIYVTFFDVGRVGRNETAIIEQERAAARSIAPLFTGESMHDVEPTEVPEE